MTTLPVSAQTRSLLADGAVLTVTATRRARANRADIKCSVAGAPALAERLSQVLRLARHTEARFDSRDQVVLSFDATPAAGERDWELAAVLADRMVRGVYQPLGPVLANGWSDQWQLGRIDGHQLAPALIDQLPPGAVLGGAAGLAHLGMLTGRPDQASAVSSARTWFPLHSGGINDRLCWVEVSVYPLDAGAGAAAGEEEDSIGVPGLDLLGQSAVRAALAAARRFDAHGVGRWRSVVRFETTQFQGTSWELAAVMADRLARGRECVPVGRILASGCSADWQAGRVDSVEAREPKLALMLAQAVAGDRLLVPAAWEGALPDGLREALAARGASIACVARIGMI
ncbi:hypothetical protein [Massilia sp. DWR3-1-1]|uniref:hypothetical protein n=1 Tax=Massilia sp. DWR3-1-1 TaxID=2804559 RepID=UPI003CFAA6EF